MLEESDRKIERGAGVVFRGNEQRRKGANSKGTDDTVVLGSIRSQQGRFSEIINLLSKDHYMSSHMPSSQTCCHLRWSCRAVIRRSCKPGSPKKHSRSLDLVEQACCRYRSKCGTHSSRWPLSCNEEAVPGTKLNSDHEQGNSRSDMLSI